MNLPYQYGSKKIHCLHIDLFTHQQCNAVKLTISGICPSCHRFPLQRHIDILTLADRLDALQKAKNKRRGINCVRTIITYMRRGDLDLAKTVFNTDGDKITNYPDVNALLCKTFNVDPNQSLFHGLENENPPKVCKGPKPEPKPVIPNMYGEFFTPGDQVHFSPFAHKTLQLATKHKSYTFTVIRVSSSNKLLLHPNGSDPRTGKPFSPNTSYSYSIDFMTKITHKEEHKEEHQENDVICQ